MNDLRCVAGSSQCVSHLKHEAARGVAKDGRGKLQPEQDRQAGGEQATEVQVLPALGDDGGAREAPKGDGGSNKPCHEDAGTTEQQASLCQPT